MSYDPSGIYNLPPVYKAEPGTTIRSEQHNSPLEDIAQALSSVLVRDGRNGMVGALGMGGFKITNLAPGTNLTDAATVGQSVLIGEVKAYALKTLPPGYLWCDGSALPSNTPYPLLRAALLADGSPYGTDGSGNPRVLDARDVTLVGRGNMGGTKRGLLSKFASTVLGAVFGTQEHTLTVAQMPPHNHGGSTSTAGAHTHSINLPRGDEQWKNGSGNTLWGNNTNRTFTTASAGNHTHTITSQGGGQPHPNVQPTTVVNYIIRAAY